MPDHEPDTEELLLLSQAGDRTARGRLLWRHRERLRHMVAARIDHRLAARLDPSDVVQEVLAEADRRLDGYLAEPPLPFYPWLRQLAVDRLIQEYRRHLLAQRRSVRREEISLGLSHRSALELADRLLAGGPSPSARLRRDEVRDQVLKALEAIPPGDREVLVLRYLEQLPARDVAGVLGISEAAAKKRALRALVRLKEILHNVDGGLDDG